MTTFTNRDFNPSGNTTVDDIKAAAENLAEIISSSCPKSALKDRALLDVQSASISAVKSLFSTK